MKESDQQIEAAFAILGVSSKSTMAEVKSSYRELIRVWHPDKHTSDARLLVRAEVEVKKINHAYDVVERALRGGWRPKTTSRSKPATSTTSSQQPEGKQADRTTATNDHSARARTTASAHTSPSHSWYSSLLRRTGSIMAVILTSMLVRAIFRPVATHLNSVVEQNPISQNSTDRTGSQGRRPDSVQALSTDLPSHSAPLEWPDEISSLSWSHYTQENLGCVFDAPRPLVQTESSSPDQGVTRVTTSRSESGLWPAFAISFIYSAEPAANEATQRERVKAFADPTLKYGFEITQQAGKKYYIDGKPYETYQVVFEKPNDHAYVWALGDARHVWVLVMETKTPNRLIEFNRFMESFHPMVLPVLAAGSTRSMPHQPDKSSKTNQNNKTRRKRAVARKRRIVTFPPDGLYGEQLDKNDYLEDEQPF